MTDVETARRHKERAKRHKAAVDEKIAAATTDKGLLLVITGNGKGKSSSAFGMAARMLGYGRRVAIFQFIKGTEDVGERAFLARQPGVDWSICGVNRRPNGTHYRRAKGDHLAALCWVDAGRGFRAGAGAGRA